MTVSWDDFTKEQQEYIRNQENIARKSGLTYGDRYFIALSKYEIDNLLWLFNVLGYKVPIKNATAMAGEDYRHPIFQCLNNGDWNGQIPWKLKAAIDNIHEYDYMPFECWPNASNKASFHEQVERHIKNYVKEKYGVDLDR